VGVKYDVNANVRTAEEVATNLVQPDKKKIKMKTVNQQKPKTSDI